ncbi:Major Facilitator Superfamily [Novymonas esmeraldas]|uniref:Major Facilitator Superfamily n=1 Tax=Novymonas esmeraldas TaxID=1808958 RepID=A0AAW0EU31_9TRYP
MSAAATPIWSASSAELPLQHRREEDSENTHVSLPNAPDTPPRSKEHSGNELPDSASGMENRLQRRKCTEPLDLIETTPFRFVVLALFAAFGFINQVQYVAFAFVIRETETYFNVGALEVNLLSLLIPVVYVIGVLPGCFVYNKVGLRYGMIIGAAVNAFASTLKLIAVWVPQYPLLVVAQLFVAMGQILFLSLPTLIAGIWFPPKERTVATAVASLLGFAGMAVGMFYSPHVVSLPDDCTATNWAALMGSQFGFSTLVLVLVVALARDKPLHRPSLTSTEDYKLPLFKFIKSQFRDLNFVLLTVSFGLITGFLTAVAGVLAQLLEPFGIDETESGLLAFSGILGGALNCALVGFLVDQTHRYKFTALGLATVSTALFVIATVLTKTVSDADALRVALYVLVPLLEFLVLPIVPVVMELAVELAYPCPETVPSTIVLASMCFFSFVGMIVFSIVLGDDPTVESGFYVLLITLIASALSIVGLLCVKEQLHRQAEDEVAPESQESSPADDGEQRIIETGVLATQAVDVRTLSPV